MHTASEIWNDAFTAHLGGAPVDPSGLLDWQPHDRFGIVVHEPFGALGAGLLISLVIAAFYDAAGRDRRHSGLYPEIYLFHVGRRWGDHSAFDFWPERKEMVVPADPAKVLEAINAAGITHLAVPDGPVRPCQHIHREPQSALDRIRQCYAYAASGVAAGADVVIGTGNSAVMANYGSALQPEFWFGEVEQAAAGLAPTTPEAIELIRVVAHTKERWNEVSREDPSYLAQRRRADDARAAGRMSEGYRRITVGAAIEMLA